MSSPWCRTQRGQTVGSFECKKQPFRGDKKLYRSLSAPSGLCFIREGSHGLSPLGSTPWAVHVVVPLEL